MPSCRPFSYFLFYRFPLFLSYSVLPFFQNFFLQGRLLLSEERNNVLWLSGSLINALHLSAKYFRNIGVAKRRRRRKANRLIAFFTFYNTATIQRIKGPH